ncbi:hypothetical protein DIPPA_18028 [Diplonema papillatum]|nr:hypothetical protein DIPPA_18028 [Diplonema papillatum]
MKLLILVACFASAYSAKSKTVETSKERKAFAQKIRNEYEKRKERRSEMEGGESAFPSGTGRSFMARLEQNIVPPKPVGEDVDPEDYEDYETRLGVEDLRSEIVSYTHEGVDYQVFTVIGEPQEAANATILFLHGSQFTHSIWFKTGIMQTMRNFGYKVVAIDLPAKGRSSTSRPPMATRGEWLLGFLEAAKIEKPILVSPAMSGTYAVPAVVKQAEAFRAWIAVSPSGAKNSTEWSRARVPTLAMYGEKDLVGNLIAASMFKSMPSLIRFRAAGLGTHFYEKSPRTFMSRLLLFLLSGLHDMQRNMPAVGTVSKPTVEETAPATTTEHATSGGAGETLKLTKPFPEQQTLSHHVSQFARSSIRPETQRFDGVGSTLSSRSRKRSKKSLSALAPAEPAEASGSLPTTAIGNAAPLLPEGTPPVSPPVSEFSSKYSHRTLSSESEPKSEPKAEE